MQSRVNSRQFLAAFLIVTAAAPRAVSQTTPSSPEPAAALLATIHEEQLHGPYLFYSQHYTDSANRPASYSGDVYAAIQSFAVHGCQVTARVTITDHFSGAAGREDFGDTQDASLYSAAFTLTPAIADNLAVTRARPIQLEPSTHSLCPSDPSCAFTWLTIRAAPLAIRETDLLNNLQVFRGNVSSFQIPLSSPAVARRLIAQLRALATACRPLAATN